MLHTNESNENNAANCYIVNALQNNGGLLKLLYIYACVWTLSHMVGLGDAPPPPPPPPPLPPAFLVWETNSALSFFSFLFLFWERRLQCLIQINVCLNVWIYFMLYIGQARHCEVTAESIEGAATKQMGRGHQSSDKGQYKMCLICGLSSLCFKKKKSDSEYWQH